MSWYEGSIPEAIGQAKQRNSIFIVFVYDKSELSKAFEGKLGNNDISSLMNGNVSIRIENGSTDAIQFAQIYPLIVVPSLFFINPQNGVPLEVIGGDVELKILIEKIRKLLNNKDQPTENAKTCPEKSTSTTEQHNSSSTTTKTVAGDSSKESSESSSSNEKTSLSNAELEAASSQAQPTSLSLDDRVERAKEIVDQRQQHKIIEELEDEKAKELERRHQFQELTKSKQKREENERNELSKQRMKEKEEDRLARERVKAQIAADREERKRRNAELRGEDVASDASLPQSSASVPSPPVSQNSKDAVARIKFRFPDNSSELVIFSSESTLGDVKNHLLEKSKLPFKNFKLVGTLPSRTFTEDQMTETLKKLQLVPSSIIIVKPVGASQMSMSPPGGGGVMALLWYIMAPVSFIFRYLGGFLGIGGVGPSQSSGVSDQDPTSQPAKSLRTQNTDSSKDKPKMPYGNRGDYYREGGNIHRLRNPGDDDDDENNTWNGNSTQQM